MLPLRIFTHIPKTAGSTLTSLIYAQYRRDEIAKIFTPDDAGAFMTSLNPKVRFITGHYAYGLHRHTTRPCDYFTFLREPVERVISLYFYLRRATDHASHARIVSGAETFLDVVRHERDVQTNYLAGTLGRKDVPDEERLAMAREHFTSRYSFGGLLERFDESLILMEAQYGWRFRPYRSQNVTANRPRRDDISTEIHEALRENNQLDAELYRFARERLDRQIAAQPAGFRDRLAAYRAGVERTRRFYGPIDRFRRRLGALLPVRR